LSQSTHREHAEGVEQKKITNLQIEKMKDQQKVIDQKRIIKSEDAKEQRQKKEVRATVQSLVSEADAALKNANGLIKKSKQANQKAQDAIEEVKSRQPKTELDQKENNGPELSQLIKEAKISDQKAKLAQEKYDDLRKLAETAVEKYNAKFK
jgi:MoxR-like ATPase